MAELYAFPKEIEQKIQEFEATDIVVGIPSFNNAKTIGHVVRSVQQGLHEHFPSARSLIVNSDGGSTDHTTEQVLGVTSEEESVLQVPFRLFPVQKLSTPYSGVPGKGSALRLIFQIARQLGAKACAVVDSDLRSITPEWINLLVRPVFEEGYDFIAPYYLRHKFDGTITNSVVYPMTRALYGKRIRQPIGGEFCFSPTLVERYLGQDVWASDVARFGIDIWVTTQAVCCGFKVGQAFLGAKIHDAKDPASDLSSMLTQVLGAMFAEAERNAKVWQRVRGSEAVPVFGEIRTLEAEAVKVDVGKMIESFNVGFKNLFELWSLVMPPAALLELKRMSQRRSSDFRFADEVWVNVVYDFAVAYHLRTMNRDHLLRALTPLYLGWVASFVLQMQSADASQVERRIEELCLRYEAQKPYLISRWRWPDRFNP